jgi:hypothetical protein
MAGWLASPAAYTTARDAARNAEETDGMSEDRVEAVARVVNPYAFNTRAEEMLTSGEPELIRRVEKLRSEARAKARAYIAALDDARDAEIARLQSVLDRCVDRLDQVRAWRDKDRVGGFPQINAALDEGKQTLQKRTVNRLNKVRATGAGAALIRQAEEVTDAQGEAVARAALDAVPRWRPIESAPKDGTPVDLWVDGRRWTNMEWNSTSPCNPYGAWKPEGASWEEELSCLNPTHWMPLPEPPTDD